MHIQIHAIYESSFTIDPFACIVVLIYILGDNELIQQEQVVVLIVMVHLNSIIDIYVLCVCSLFVALCS